MRHCTADLTAITHFQTATRSVGRALEGAKYDVKLEQLGDPRSSLQSVPVSAPHEGFMLCQSADSVKFACAIRHRNRGLQDKPYGVHFRLIFDRNVPLWRHEFVDSPVMLTYTSESAYRAYTISCESCFGIPRGRLLGGCSPLSSRMITVTADVQVASASKRDKNVCLVDGAWYV